MDCMTEAVSGCETRILRVRFFQITEPAFEKSPWSKVLVFIPSCKADLYWSLISNLSLNHEGRWGTTDNFATSFLHFALFSTALRDFPNSRPVHSLMLSSRLFLCLPCLLPPLTVPCKMVLARPDERETWPLSLRFASLYDSQVFVWSDWLLDLGTDFLVGYMVFVWDA